MILLVDGTFALLGKANQADSNCMDYGDLKLQIIMHIKEKRLKIKMG